MSDTIMIPIPAPPDGWVFDRIRKAKNGEQYFRDGRWIHNYFSDTTLIHPVAIPIPTKWTPPPTWGEMFGDCWLAVDDDMVLTVWAARPYGFDKYWTHDQLSAIARIDWDRVRPELLPPTDIPWKEAMWKIEAPK